MYLHAKSGLMCREDTHDEKVWEEQRAYRGLVKPGDRLLDIGANIGMTAAFAFAAGAEEVTSVEPEQDNFRMLEINTAKWGPRSQRIRAAVVPGDADTGEISFFLGKDSMPSSHTVRPTRGRPEIKVPAIGFRHLFAGGAFDCVKMDVERAEFALLPDILWAAEERLFNRIAIEIHLKRDGIQEEGKAFAAALAERMNILKDPKVTGQGWIAQGIWEVR